MRYKKRQVSLKFLSKIPKRMLRKSGVAAVYVFGSRVDGRPTPLSDYDFGVFFNFSLNKKRRSKIRQEIFLNLCKVLKTDRIDILSLNDIFDPVLAYNVVVRGKNIYTKDIVQKIIYEIKIRKIYEDTAHLRRVGFYFQNERIKSGAFGLRAAAAK